MSEFGLTRDEIQPYYGYVGVDIGGQTIKLAAFDGDELKTSDIVTTDTFEEAMPLIVESAQKLVGGTPKGLGIGSVGPLDIPNAYLEWTPNLKWKKVHYKKLEEPLGCPVIVDNDANVAGLAEAVLGAGKGYRIISGFTLGTGVGFFTVIDNKIQHGRFDLEGGHQILNPDGPLCGCGGRGCLEVYASATGIKNRTGKAPDQIDDPEFWKEIGKYLAWGIANVNVLVNPEAFILCGGMIQRGEMLIKPIIDELANLCKIYAPPKVLIARLGAKAGAVGGIVLAKHG